MKIEQLFPPPLNKVDFKFSSFKLVPKESGCYVLSTFENHILYIGLSDNLFQRFQQHLKKSEKVKPTIEGRAVWFHFTTYDATNLPKLERTWLNQFETAHGQKPIMNKIESPIS